MTTRLVTLNLAGLDRHWFEQREKLVIAGLRRLEPDIVCFQECTMRYGTKVYDQARVIGGEIGLRYSVFSPYGNVVETMSPDQGGVAVIGRWPILTARHRRLPPGHGASTDARVALLVSFETESGKIDVVTTHLSWKEEELESRLVQIGVTLNELSLLEWGRPDSRAVLVGDLNATEDEPAMVLLRGKLKDAFRDRHPQAPGHTWIPDNPYAGDWPSAPRRLDYVFCTQGTKVLSAEVVLNDPPVSDHFGLMVDLQWANRKGEKE